MKYIKKPVIIEAFQLGYEKSPQWFWNSNHTIDTLYEGDFCIKCTIQTLEGVMIGNKGDMIIHGIQGEIYPCKKDIFDASYNPYIEKPYVEDLDD